MSIIVFVLWFSKTKYSLNILLLKYVSCFYCLSSNTLVCVQLARLSFSRFILIWHKVVTSIFQNFDYDSKYQDPRLHQHLHLSQPVIAAPNLVILNQSRVCRPRPLNQQLHPLVALQVLIWLGLVSHVMVWYIWIKIKIVIKWRSAFTGFHKMVAFRGLNYNDY